MKVLELRGFKSLQAMQAFHKLMLGLKMLPAYMGETYEDFYERVSEMSEADQEKLIREAALFVELQKEEFESMACFVADANGVPYTAENIKGLDPSTAFEIIVQVSVALSKIKINFVSEAEKKK